MSFCIHCGQELADSANFCVNCGETVGASPNGTQKQRKTIYEGEIHKCPNCGEILDSFTVRCPACGYELRGTKATNSVREFAMKLEKIESEREKTKPQFIFAKALTDENISKTDKQKINLIRSFSIPNTKEDIYEFMILAATNIDLKLYGLGDQGVLTASQREVSDAWIAKFEQAYQKALVAFGNSSEFLGIKNIYDTKMDQLKKKKRQKPLLIIGLIAGSLILVAIIWLLVFLTGSI